MKDIIYNGTIADMKAADQMICEEEKESGCLFVDFLRGANRFLELAKMNASEYDEKVEKRLIAYMTAIRDFGIRTYYQLNDEETDLTEVWVSNSRWTVTLKQKDDGMWYRYITKTIRKQYSTVEEDVSIIYFQRYDDAGNDTLRFTGIDLSE